MDIAKLLDQRANEAKQRPAETLADRIGKYLDGGMSADAMDELYRTHQKEIDREIQRRKAEAARLANAERADLEDYARKIWKGSIRTESYFSDQKQFLADYPQFCQTWENIEAIARVLRDQNLIPDYGGIVTAFTQLTSAGRLLISPAAVEAGPEDQVTGEELKRHPNLLRLLARAPSEEEREREKIAKMSADEFKKSRPELSDNRIPPLVLQSIERLLSTFRQSHPEYLGSAENEHAMTDAILKSGLPVSTQLLESVYRELRDGGQIKIDSSVDAQHGATRIVMYQPEQRTPARSQKPSFRQKLESMTSTEVAERCANDPAFKAALDSLGE